MAGAHVLDNAVGTRFYDSTIYSITGGLTYNTNNYSAEYELLRTNSALGAAYNSKERHPASQCTKGTRKDLLSDITQWMMQPETGPLVCWMEGPAGYGKSSISQTLANACADVGKLGGSFFFSRKVKDRSSAEHFFPTLAFQLLHSYPLLRSHILDALREDQTVFDVLLRDQLRQLILDPVKRADPNCLLPMKIVVIDALDECVGELASEALTLILEAVSGGFKLLKFLITGRPEKRLKDKTTKAPVRLLKIIDLTMYDTSVDIRVFLEHELDRIRLECELKEPDQAWPGDALDALVKKSDGLFVYASTAIQLVGNPDEFPDEQLGLVLNAQASDQFSRLDQLYQGIVSGLNAKGRSVAAILTILFDSVSANCLRQLLANKHGPVGTALKHLRSVFAIPDKPDTPIPPCHLSFREFFCTPSRSGTLAFDSTRCHGEIALMCLQLMAKSLKQDICELSDYAQLNAEYDDLEERREEYIGPGLRYACRYWASHLMLAPENELLVEAVLAFGRTSVLHWLEVLSLVEGLRRVPEAIRDASTWLKSLKTKAPGDAIGRLSELGHVYASFIDGISVSALSIYPCAQLFFPSNTLLPLPSIHTTMRLKLLSDKESHWDPHIRTIDIGTYAHSIEFLPDSSGVVSSSVEGVHLWDVTTGSKAASYSDGNHRANRMAISLDGIHLALSYSYPDSVAVFNIATGRQIYTFDFQCKCDSTIDIAWLPDPIQDRSPPNYGMLLIGHNVKWRIVDVSTGTVFKSLTMPGDPLSRCFEISLDGTRIAISCYKRGARKQEDNLYLWDIPENSYRELAGHIGSVDCLDFSQDSQRLISASSHDRKLCLWDAASCTLLKSHDSFQDLRCHFLVRYRERENAAISLSRFHCDGIKIQVTSLDDGRCINSRTINDEADYNFYQSPRSSHSAALFNHRVIRVFPTLTPDTKPISWTSERLSEVAFSTQSGQIATLFRSSEPSKLDIWNVPTGETEIPLPYKLLQASPDGTRFICARLYSSAVLLDETGKVVETLHHVNYNTTIEFSPDSSTIAVHTRSDHLELLKGQNGQSLGTIDGLYPVHHIAFSPDGTRILLFGWNLVRLSDIKTMLDAWTLSRDFASRPVFSLDGSHLALCTQSATQQGTVQNTLQVLSVNDRRVVTRFVSNTRAMPLVRFSPDMACIAVSTADRNLFMIDRASNRAQDVRLPRRTDVGELLFSGGRLFGLSNPTIGLNTFAFSLAFARDYHPSPVETTRCSDGPAEVTFDENLIILDQSSFRWEEDWVRARQNTVRKRGASESLPADYFLRDGWLYYQSKRLVWMPHNRRDLFIARDGVIGNVKPFMLLDVQDAIL